MTDGCTWLEAEARGVAAAAAAGAPVLLRAASKKALWAAARAPLTGVVRAGSGGVEPGRGGWMAKKSDPSAGCGTPRES